MTIKIISDLSNVINSDSEKDNNYSIFESVKDSYGVYIFQDKKSNEILYVGAARKQTVKDRVIQNFTEKDTGGTFRKNYMEENKLSFEEFSNNMKEFKVIVIECPNDTTIISSLKEILISVLNPKNNI